jgi:hypothetical protein
LAVSGAQESGRDRHAEAPALLFVEALFCDVAVRARKRDNRRPRSPGALFREDYSDLHSSDQGGVAEDGRDHHVPYLKAKLVQ